MKKKSQNGFEEHREGALLEDINDQISVIAEMLTDVKKTQDQHTELLEQHSEILEKIIIKLDNKVDRTEIRKSALIHSS